MGPFAGGEILPFWDQKIYIGPGGPFVSKNIINSNVCWTLVKPNFELRPVSKTADRTQSHSGSGRPLYRTNSRFLDFQFFLVLHIFGEVFVDLVPKVAQILQKVGPNPWDFGLGLMGPSL